ncbi:hypothetical protein KM043_005492 [Ampulex compressa]|nr:hypothetical protein KM043_005492 [Ampulex compressa]
MDRAVGRTEGALCDRSARDRCEGRFVPGERKEGAEEKGTRFGSSGERKEGVGGDWRELGDNVERIKATRFGNLLSDDEAPPCAVSSSFYPTWIFGPTG